MTARARFVTIGRILKPHGVRGEVKVAPLTADFERFKILEQVTMVSPDAENRRNLTVVSARPVQGAWLMRFAEFDAPEPLREYAGWTLEVPREEAIVPPPGQVLYADMIGLEAVEASTGRPIGTVQAILSAGNELLEISTAEGEVLIPWVEELVGPVDLNAGQVFINAIPGLLDPQP